MKKNIPYTIIFPILIISIVISSVMPFNIYAEDVYDSSLVYYGPIEELQVQYSTKPNDPDTRRNRYIKRPANTQTVFATWTQSGYKRLGTYTFSTVSDQSDYGWKESGGGVTNTSWHYADGTSLTYVYDNVTYYVYYDNFNQQYGYINSEINVSTNLGSNGAGSSYYDQATLEKMFKYTGYYYGIEDDTVVQGDLTFNYYTDFASNQQNNADAMKSNRDTIIWDYDATNSNIPATDLKVDIRAVPTKYYAVTEDALNSLTWSDLSIEASYASDLGSYQINWNNRKVSYTWEEVVDGFKFVSNLPSYYDDMVNFWNFNKRYSSDYWYWTGWVYQIRLNTWSGDYTGEWQTIYQISSAPPEGSSETINYYVTGNGLTEPVYQTIQNVNNQNNITNNTWYVNGNPFDVNSDDGDENWLTKILELILDAVFGTLRKLVDAITSLLIGSLEAIIDFFTNIWDRFLNLFDVINFSNDNQEYDLDIPQGESFLDIIPAFIRGMSSAGLSYMIWIPLVVGIIFIVL